MVVGLSEQEAERRAREYGKNELVEYQKPSLISSVIEGIQPQIYFFLFANVLLFFYNILYGAICLAIILAVIFLDALDDVRIKEKIAGIRTFSQRCTVLRDGKKREIDVTEIVPGDVLFLKAGDRVPADGFVLNGSARVSEEIFGRGIKEKRAISESERKEIIAFKKENPSALLAGTFLVEGELAMVVESTGPRTAFAKMAQQAEKREDIARIERFVDEINPVIFVISAIIFISLVVRGENAILALSIAAAAAVAGLPYYIYMAAQLTFFTSIERVSKKFLIRNEGFLNKLNVDVVCIEGIKNLTLGEKTVKKIWIGGKEIDVTGDGYDLNGEFLFEGKKLEGKEGEELSLLLDLCAISSFSKIKNGYVSGEEIENALLVLALKQKAKESYAQIERLERQRKKKGGLIYTKCSEKGLFSLYGDAFLVLKRCRRIHGIDEKKVKDEKWKIERKIIELSASGYETIGIGYKRTGEKGYTFTAILAIKDPLRQDAQKIIESIRSRGIEVIILTSEKESLAVDLARKLGLLKAGKRAMIAEDFVNSDEKERQKALESCVVFARASDKEKSEILKELRKSKSVLLFESIAKDKAVLAANCNVVNSTASDMLKWYADAVGDIAAIADVIDEANYYERCLRKIVYSIFTLDFMILFYVFATSLIYGTTLNPVMILAINSIADTFSGLSIPKKTEVMEKRKRREKLLSLKEVTFSFVICVFVALSSLLIADPTFGACSLIFAFIFVTLSYAYEGSIFKEFNAKDFGIALAMAAFFIFILFFPVVSFFGLRQITVNELAAAAFIATIVLAIFEVRKAMRW